MKWAKIYINILNVNQMTDKDLTDWRDSFNSLYPIGTVLTIVNDDLERENRKLISHAWIAGHSVVANFEGLVAAYDVSRVILKMKYKTSEIGATYMVPCDGNGCVI